MHVILRSASLRHLALFNSLFFSLSTAMDEAKVSSMIANSNKELLSQFKTLISDSFSYLKRSNEATASQQIQEIKRIKRDPVPRFNKKSNEDQFKANKAVTEAVEDAQAALRTKDLEIKKGSFRQRYGSSSRTSKAHIARWQVAVRLEDSVGIQTP